MEATDLRIPKLVHKASEMPDPMREHVLAVARKYAVSDEAVTIFDDGLVALDDDNSLVVAAYCSAMYTKGLFREGFAQEVLLAMRKTEASVEPSKPPTPPKSKRRRARGLLPFSRMKRASEDRASYMIRFEKESMSSGGVYPLDMLDWTTGVINWATAAVYTYQKNTLEWFVYSALLVGARTYDELLALEFKGTTLRGVQDDVDYILKHVMVEPSWLPPGAGEYCEDPDTGKMWIAREDRAALIESLPWRRTA